MSSSRTQRTRERILDAANALLLDRGYKGVGLEAVAAAAGVSRQTVYDRFGSKAGLLTAMITRAEEKAGLPERLEVVRAQTSGRAMLSAMLDTLIHVEPQVYPHSRIVYAARLEDPTAADLWQWRMTARHAGLRMIFERLAAEGRLLKGIRSDEAADIAGALTSPHEYEYLVLWRGWSLKRYRAHLESSIAALLVAPSREARKSPSRKKPSRGK